MFSRRSKVLGLGLALADLVVTAIAFELAYILRQHLSALPDLKLFYLERGIAVGLLVSVLVIWWVVGAALGVYRRAELFDAQRIARDTVRQAFLSTIILMGWLYLLKLGDVSRLFVLFFVFLNTLLLLVCRLSARSVRRLRRRDTANMLYYVIVGTGEKAVEVARLIEANEDLGNQVLAFVRERGPAAAAWPGEAAAGAARSSDAASGAPPATGIAPRPEAAGLFREAAAAQPAPGDWMRSEALRHAYPVRALDELPRMLEDHAVDEIVFAVGKHDLAQMEDIFLSCEEEGVKVRVLVSFFPHVSSDISLEKLHDLPLLTFSTTPENEYLFFFKRLFDVAFAAVLVVLLAPLLAAIAMAVRLSSPGPVIFSQVRCGLNGRRFRLHKFRSMYADADARRAEVAHLNEMDGPVFKAARDPRVTPLGRFLRKFSLDEWPQLFNILQGDMSFVGPRPPLPGEVQRYERWQRRRLRMKPGLTCLWALEGRNKLDFRSWMKWDLHYIDHWSLLLDLKILLRSIPHVLSGKGV